MTKNNSNHLCNITDILSLHFNHQILPNDNSFGNVLLGICSIILPFLNEITNLLTITWTKPYYQYEIFPHKENLQKMIIELLSIFGIILNVAYETNKYNNIQPGIIKGICFLIFAYAIPNLYMDDIISLLPNNNFIKLLGGIFIIYILEILISSCSCFINSLLSDDKVKS